jgi:alkylation response protein AidB-like acyl-CoA dehydrogenase
MGFQHEQALSAVITDVVQPASSQTDRLGEFPDTAIAAMAEAGLLGLVSSADVGGAGADMTAAADVVERLSGVCGSTAMVVLMHYAAVAAIEAHGPARTREAIAAGQHLTTLAFSEAGSRSHFWAPLSTAADAGASVRIDASKSWVTSAGHADSYVWSSRPLRAEGPMTLWLVPSDTPGLTTKGTFDGIGLRGNASCPVLAQDVRVPATAMLGDDGAGLDIALGVVLPWFLVLSAAFSLGVAEKVTAQTGQHLTSTRLVHLDASLAEQPVSRLAYARMRLRTDEIRAFVDVTCSALAQGRPEATLRLLECKALAAEAAGEVADQAMRLCGGAAFRKELAIERHMRDSLAARVMAPTTEALLDFVGRAACGLPLFDQAAPAAT